MLFSGKKMSKTDRLYDDLAWIWPVMSPAEHFEVSDWKNDETPYPLIVGRRL